MTRTGGRLLPALLLLLLVAGSLGVALGAASNQDAVALRALLSNWEKAPANWGNGDPCDTPWEGIACENSRVISVKLSSMGIKGTLSGDIGALTELQTLDLSFNPDLGGTLTSSIGSLTKLSILILPGCSFTGSIPKELGNLLGLTYIALNNNQFNGPIPASLGNLAKLYWLDLAENQLTGSLPVSSGSNPGLDRLFNTKHFHFNKNKLSGNIPSQIFNSNMTLLHVLFDQNQLSGEIPDSIGLVTTLEVLRLDRNLLTGRIPPSLNNLTRVQEVHLASNQLSGIIPDLSSLGNLNYLDLSNNPFAPSEAPTWLTRLTALTTIAIDDGNLGGLFPSRLLAIPQLQKASFRNNSFNGTLDLTGIISQQLQLVDLRNNSISIVPQGNSLKASIALYGNPYCMNMPSGNAYCLLQLQLGPAYKTSLGNCISTSCSQGQSIIPGNCGCAFPFNGKMVFRAPSFSDLTSSTRFQLLEKSLIVGLRIGTVSLQNIIFNQDNYLEIQVSLFPSDGSLFNNSEIQRIGFSLSNQTYKPPPEFGPYFFIGIPYIIADLSGTGTGKSSMSTAAVAGIAVGCSILIIILVIVGLYALKQKRKAEKAIVSGNPFASWVPSGSDAASAPELKGARWFSFDDLKKCTSSFSESNILGSGGYGKVYRGTLSTGQLVAVKRAEQGSMQGAAEFKTEIELLSRLHHKNLVGLVGFCYDKGEQMLVYEYIPNGTLRETLSGTTGIPLDWKKRLRIALGSARGLAYLHELADPPIIHRDVKSSNILLDEDLNAKVADFGLSKLVSDTEKGHVSTQVKGTLGYLDPEYYMTQNLTDKSDVYSFGVVMLELITGKLPIEKGKYIVREIRNALDARDEAHYGLDHLMDPTICDTSSIVFTRFVDLALQCVEESGNERPSMNEVVKEIEAMLQLEGSNPASAASSATEFKRGNPPRHPYNGHLPTMETSTDSFGKSTGYTTSSTFEPK